MSTDLAAVLDAASDAIVAVDPDGRITHWNSGAESLLGHPHDAVIGETLALIIPPEHRAGHITAFHTAIDRGQLAHDGQPTLITATHRDAHLVPAVMTLGIIDSDSDARGILAVLRRPGDPTSFV
jgi:PAS domain S-box-containing protein